MTQWVAFGALTLCLAVPAAANDSHTVKVTHQPASTTTPWRTSSTKNFLVHACCCEKEREDIARQCEEWRGELMSKWLGKESPAWKVKCHVVLHKSRNGYLQAVGAGASQTNGSTYIKFDQHDVSQVQVRRIDLLSDRAGNELAALPHELTHVVLAERFAGQQPPRWVDEGLAVLADPLDKQQRHLRDARQAFARGTHFRALELLTLEDYPRNDRVPAFYGQSLALAQLLTQRDDPAKVLTFLDRSRRIGHDRALREVYDIQGLAELERLWQRRHEELIAVN